MGVQVILYEILSFETLHVKCTLFENHDAIATVTGIGNLKQLKKNARQQNFVVEDVPYQLARNQKEVDQLEKQLLEKSPFFHGIHLNPKTEL